MGRTAGGAEEDRRTADDEGEDGPSVGLNQRWKKGGEEINSEGGGTGQSFVQG